MYNCSCFNADHDNESVNGDGDKHPNIEPEHVSNVDQNGNEGKGKAIRKSCNNSICSC